MLVTEPGNLDAPVAFIFFDSEKKEIDMIKITDAVAENHELLDRTSKMGGFCRMDLRDRGRADSKRGDAGMVLQSVRNPQRRRLQRQ